MKDTIRWTVNDIMIPSADRNLLFESMQKDIQQYFGFKSLDGKKE